MTCKDKNACLVCYFTGSKADQCNKQWQEADRATIEQHRDSKAAYLPLGNTAYMAYLGNARVSWLTRYLKAKGA